MEDFFKAIDSLRILERNSAFVEGLEFRQIRRMIKAYKKALGTIRLNTLLAQDNSFTKAKLEIASRVIERTLTDLKRALKPEMALSFEFMGEQGIEDSAKEINVFEKNFEGIVAPVNISAVLASTEPQNFLFNQYQASVDKYSAGLRAAFQRDLTQSLIMNQGWSQTVFKMEQSFNLTQWELARIVRTELHNIYNISKLDGFSTIKKDYFPDLQKSMYHPMDSRTGDDSIQMAREDLIVDLDKPFVFKYKGKIQRFMAPPNRPNDRAILIPYRKRYDK